MGGIWAGILQIVTGPFFGLLLKGYTEKLKAAGDHDNRALDLAKRALELDAMEARLNNDRKTQILGHWYAPENLFAYFIAFPYWFKAVTMDNVIGSIWELGWSTPHLQGQTAEIMMMIMVFWFGKRTINTVAAIISSAFGKR